MLLCSEWVNNEIRKRDKKYLKTIEKKHTRNKDVGQVVERESA